MPPDHSSGWLSASILLLALGCPSVLASVQGTATNPNCQYPEPTSHAFWVLGCAKPILVERADPIQYPGVPSSHLHTIMGGNAFDFDLDYNKTQQSTCTTCAVTKDLSNYWIPTLYFRAENGSFLSVEQVGGLNVYYQERMDWTEYCSGKSIEPFPRGLRMIAGDHTRRRHDSNILEHQAIEYICLPGPGELGVPAVPHFPNRTSCDGGLQIRVRFPSCWDGVNLDSPNHQSHMAYPSRLDNGICPSSHPVRLLSLLYETTWSITKFNNLRKPGDQPFVLSQGDPTGYGFHGDFLNGWDVELLRTAIKDPSCGDSSGGQIHQCKTFRPFVQDSHVQNQCPTLPGRLRETVTGALPSLPGCNSIQYGPNNAVVEDCPESAEAPPLPPTIPSTDTKDGQSGRPEDENQGGQEQGDEEGSGKGGPPGSEAGDSSDGSGGSGSDSDSEGDAVEVVETEIETLQPIEEVESSASGYKSTWVGAAFRFWGGQMNGIRFAVMP